MNHGFWKVFKNLKKYSGAGSLEGWIRRIMVNTSLDENRRRPPTHATDLEAESRFLKTVPAHEGGYDLEVILKTIASLPEGYRLVFNLSEIDGYAHHEIADQLGISESASRSQLARAKKLLREKLKNISEL